MQATHSCLHLLLAAKGLQVPLSARVSTVPGKAWAEKAEGRRCFPRTAARPHGVYQLLQTSPSEDVPASGRGLRPGTAQGGDLAGSGEPRPGAPTYLYLLWPNVKGCDDAGQKGLDLLEVGVANTPGPVHQEDYVSGRRGKQQNCGSAGGGKGQVLSLPRAGGRGLGVQGCQGPQGAGHGEPHMVSGQRSLPSEPCRVSRGGTADNETAAHCCPWCPLSRV